MTNPLKSENQKQKIVEMQKFNSQIVIFISFINCSQEEIKESHAQAQVQDREEGACASQTAKT
jgi:hypothetical protein